MDNKNKLHTNSKRFKGQKADIFFDSIDYSILALTQSSFKKPNTLAEELKISPKNLHPHLMKLVKIGLLDGVLDSNDNEYAFTTYFKVSGERNEWNFSQDTRTTIQFLNDIYSYIQSEKFDNAMDKLITSDGMPEIKKNDLKVAKPTENNKNKSGNTNQNKDLSSENRGDKQQK